MQKIYQGELLQVIQADLSKQEILERLENYHFSDIADALEQTATEKRLYIYSVLGLEKTAEIFSFYEYVEDYIKELSDVEIMQKGQKELVKAATADNIQAQINLAQSIEIIAASVNNPNKVNIKSIRNTRQREQTKNHIDYIRGIEA